MSYLPLAHVFEMLVETALWYGGARVGFSQGNAALIMDDLKELKPTVFPSVPRYGPCRVWTAAAVVCRGARPRLVSPLHVG